MHTFTYVPTIYLSFRKVVMLIPSFNLTVESSTIYSTNICLFILFRILFSFIVDEDLMVD